MTDRTWPYLTLNSTYVFKFSKPYRYYIFDHANVGNLIWYLIALEAIGEACLYGRLDVCPGTAMSRMIREGR